MMTNNRNLEWTIHSLKRALLESSMSKDPSNRVGAIIVGPDREVRSTGFNGFPRGVKDDERLNDKALKRKIIVHAEENAILNAARIGVSVKDCTLFWIGNKAGKIWGGCPCVRCIGSIINSGITHIVSVTPENMPDTWLAEQPLAQEIRDEGSVEIWEVPLEVVLPKLEMFV